MPSINMQNAVTEESFNENTPAPKSFGYVNGLKNTWAFSVKSRDFKHIFKLFLLLARLFTLIFYSLYYVIRLIAGYISELCKRSKFAKRALIILVIIGVMALIDFIAFYGKIYPGVYVGELDLGGKTVEEAATLIEQTYADRLTSNDVIIYSNKEAQDEGTNEDAPLGHTEELSVEQARETVKYWKTNSVELEASLPTADIVDKAANSTRGLQNIFNRLGALIFKQNIKPYADFNESAVHEQIARVNDTIGKPVVNPTCVIEEAFATAKEGSDGNLVKDEEFIDQLNEAFFKAKPEEANFIPKLYHANQKVSFASAQILADKINKSLEKEVSFEYRGNKWTVDKLNLSQWINVEVQNRMDDDMGGCSCAAFTGENYCICALVDSNKAGEDILVHTREQNSSASNYSIKFVKEASGITVKTQGDFDMPNITEAIEGLNNHWLENAAVFEANHFGARGSTTDDPVHIEIGSTKVPESLSLENAVSIGVVSTISTYTTTYSSGAGTENRNKNIALGAAALNNTICAANGGQWCFNDIVGDTTTDKGYLEASAILGNRYTKSVGGGICQVATTVFNCVYDSGFQVPVRYNHDLYMASYPEGRDAAINYPDLDLIWQNNEDSDVLVTSSTTGYSITVNMLGVNPGYTVKTESGEWTPGDHYKQEFVVDPAKEPNSKKVQTSGADGKSIVIKRLVYNRDGQLVRTDEFKSHYKPKSEIIVLGPGDEANKLLAEHKARMKDETDNW